MRDARPWLVSRPVRSDGKGSTAVPDERHAMYGAEPRACGLGRAALGLAVVERPRLQDGGRNRGGVRTPLAGAASPARVDDAMDVASDHPSMEQFGGWDTADIPDGEGEANR